MTEAFFAGFSCATTDVCPHSTRSDASPATCSQCLGASPHRVSIAGPLVLVDGSPAGRTIDVESESAQRRYSKRGGNALRRSKT